MSVSKSEIFTVRCEPTAAAIRSALVGATNDEIPGDAVLASAEVEPSGMPGVYLDQVIFTFERQIKS